MNHITNPKILEFMDSYHSSLNQDMAAWRAEAEAENIPIILKETEDLLAVVLSLKKPKRILEVGTAVGYSACFFAQVCHQAKLVTIEIEQERVDQARREISKRGLEDRIQVIHGDASQVISLFCDQWEEDMSREGQGLTQGLDQEQEEAGDPSAEDFPHYGFDLLFLDAAKSHYDEFMHEAMPILADDALIICDNILQGGMTADESYDPKKRHRTSIRRMRTFMDSLCQRQDLEVRFTAAGDGLAFCRLKKKECKDCKDCID